MANAIITAGPDAKFEVRGCYFAGDGSATALHVQERADLADFEVSIKDAFIAPLGLAVALRAPALFSTPLRGPWWRRLWARGWCALARFALRRVQL